MEYVNPDNYTVELTPVLRNLASEGSLDTSVVNGVSLQRTLAMVETLDAQGHRKMVVGKRDGASFDDVVQNPVLVGWKTVVDTVWIYPVADLNSAIAAFQAGENPFVSVGDRMVFTDISHLYSFYGSVYEATAVSQPVGNVGYSLGVGTVLEDLGVTIHFDLESGLRVATWRLVRQITSQADVLVGGDSPDGTIGFLTIYSDWDEDGALDPVTLDVVALGFEYADKVLVEPV